MRYLVVSDIHANWQALQAILADAEGLYDQVLNCGDVVGYGPDPNAVTDWCRANTPLVIRGNHDKACSGVMNLEWFNDVAKQAALWTQQELTPENLAWLHNLPAGPLTFSEFQVFHGSPADEDEYISECYEVEYSAQFIERNLIFFGHTHLQGAFQVHRGLTRRLRDKVVALEPDGVYFINPGSVGQPRDGDPRAAYAIYDRDQKVVELRRAAYDVFSVQSRILEQRLPQVLGLRLQIGR